MAVIAFDGSQYILPSSKEIRKEFDTEEPNLKPGGRYFPQAMVMTAFDVFRKIPIARTISHTKTSERAELIKMLQDLPVKTLSVLDRGYYGYEVFCRIIHETQHHFLAKVPMTSSFKEIDEFVASGKSESRITISPTASYLRKVKKGETQKVENEVPIEVRVIRTKLGDTEFILVTSLLDEQLYSTEDLIKLYRARWEVENYYRDEKQWLTIENFMSKSVLGVKQELFTSGIMSLVSRVALYSEEQKNEQENEYDDEEDKKGEPQYFNAITAIARALPRMVALGTERCKVFINNLLKEIVLTRYHRSNEFRSFERISRSPQNKWKSMALKKLAALK